MSALGMSPRDRGHGGPLPRPALLFCPADRPDRYAKALAAADLVVIDLEDAVRPAAKQAAREALLANPVDPERVMVRVNAVGTQEFEADLAALRGTAYRMVMLPKAEDATQLGPLARWQVIALCETPLGVLNAAALAAAPGVTALMWGAEDLIASMNGRTSRHGDGRYRQVALHARSAVLLAATAYGKDAIDSVYIDIRDLPGLAAEAEDAAASGFALKACIHPKPGAGRPRRLPRRRGPGGLGPARSRRGQRGRRSQRRRPDDRRPPDPPSRAHPRLPHLTRPRPSFASLT